MTKKLVTNYRLAKFLLDYKPNSPIPTLVEAKYKVDPQKFTDLQLNEQIAEIAAKLRKFHNLSLSTFTHFQGNAEHLYNIREDKVEMLEHHQVYDKYILSILKEFCVMTISLLVKLERMHKKHILCGNVTPYTFMYDRITKECSTCNIDILLSDSGVVRAEKRSFGDLIYVNTALKDIQFNKYLAPELKNSMQVYYLQHRLNGLLAEVNNRGLTIANQNDLDAYLNDFHQKQVKYTNRAEIYSVGYTINQILSHQLEKLAIFGLMPGEKITKPISADIIEEADALLPHEFANPHKERVLELLNEAIEYIYDLMQEHMELRDTLPISIEKFVSLLKRIKSTAPASILEAEEPEGEEHEGGHAEEHEAHEHGEHEHEEHEAHEHAEHEHVHEHEEHEHAEHEHAHEEHEHAEHEHAEHEEHEHAEHEHEAHEHEEHEHAEHEHEHEEHEHAEHEHEHEEHEDHKAHGGGHDDHEEHEHAEHEHEEHEHAHGEHETEHEAHEELHEQHAHIMHILHERHLHEEKLHEEEHAAHAHGEHGAEHEGEHAAGHGAEHPAGHDPDHAAGHGSGGHGTDSHAEPHTATHGAAHATHVDDHAAAALTPPPHDPTAPPPVAHRRGHH